MRPLLCWLVVMLLVPAAAEADAVPGDYGGGAIAPGSKPLSGSGSASTGASSPAG